VNDVIRDFRLLGILIGGRRVFVVIARIIRETKGKRGMSNTAPMDRHPQAHLPPPELAVLLGVEIINLATCK
jgi:hypothetical protein